MSPTQEPQAIWPRLVYSAPNRVNEPQRPKSPSLSDAWNVLTEDHRTDSDPPLVQSFDRAVGRTIRLGVRWLWKTRAGTLTAAAVSSAMSALLSDAWRPVTHLWAWLHTWGHR